MYPASPCHPLFGLWVLALLASDAAEETSSLDGLWAASGGAGIAPVAQLSSKGSSSGTSSSSAGRSKQDGIRHRGFYLDCSGAGGTESRLQPKSLRSTISSPSQVKVLSVGVVSGMVTEFLLNWLSERVRAALHHRSRLMLLLRPWSKLRGAAVDEARRGTLSHNFRALAAVAASFMAVAFSLYPARLTWDMMQKRRERAASKTCFKGPPAKAQAKGKPPQPPKAMVLGKAKAVAKAKANTGVKTGRLTDDDARNPSVSPFGRKIHWVSPVYQDNDAIGSTVFGTLASGDSDPAFDRNLLTAMFKKEESGRKRPLTIKPMGMAVLDTNRAQAIGIAISKIRMPIMDLCRLVTSIDVSDSRLSLDEIELLAAAMPSTEEKIKLQGHEHRVETLRDVEQKMMPLCNLSPGRLRLTKLSLTHEDVYKSITRRCQSLEEAAEEVRTSVPFRRFLGMALQVGNFINTGEAASHKGSVRGFAVESLAVLASCKKGPVSAMHFLCLTIRSTDAEFGDKLLESLLHVQIASRERVHALKGAVVDFGKEVEFVNSHLEACGAEDDVRDALKCLWDATDSERRDLDHLLASALQRVTAAQAYFNVVGNAKAQPPAEEFFQNISSFLDLFRSAWVEVARHGDRWQKRYEHSPEKQDLMEKAEKPRNESHTISLTDRPCSDLVPDPADKVDAHCYKPESSSLSLVRQTSPDETQPAAARRGSWRRQLHKADTKRKSGSRPPRLLAGTTSNNRALTPDNADQSSKQGLCSWYALHMDDTDSEEEIGLPLNTLVRAVTSFANIIPDQAPACSGDVEQDRLNKQMGLDFDFTPNKCRLLRSWIEWMPQEGNLPRFTTL